MYSRRLLHLCTAVACLFSSTFCNAQSGTITTIVGTGVAGFGGDGGPGIAASINNPNAVYSSTTGLVYISDAMNHRIRELKDFGVIFTIAGNGTAGYGSDGVVSTTTSLYQPSGVVADASGNVYIGDMLNHRVRMVDGSTGLISTIGGTGSAGFGGDGGPATAAQFNRPYGLTLDGVGNLYVADQYNHRVRKINLASGIVTTILGNGTSGSSGDGGPATAALIDFPNYVHADGAGNLYVTDNGNHKIRKINTSGIINTVVGTGVGGFSGDGGPATDAQLYFPAGITLDTAGNLYVTDFGNNCIRKVSPTGFISTIAGNSTVAGFSGDGGPATAAKLNRPLDITTDHLGNVYIFDGLNNRIRKIAPPPPSAPVAGLSTTAASVCEGNCLTFNSTSTGTIDSMRWVAPGATVSMPTFTGTDVCFPTTGSFSVHLYVYGPGGVDSSSTIISVSLCPTGIPATSNGTGDFWLSQSGLNTLSINSSQSLSETLEINIFDASGRKISHDTWAAGTHSKQIRGLDVPPGLYIIKLTGQNTTSVVKWLKQ